MKNKKTFIRDTMSVESKRAKSLSVSELVIRERSDKQIQDREIRE